MGLLLQLTFQSTLAKPSVLFNTFTVLRLHAVFYMLFSILLVGL
jgi:hypothetical protein